MCLRIDSIPKMILYCFLLILPSYSEAYADSDGYRKPKSDSEWMNNLKRGFEGSCRPYGKNISLTYDLSKFRNLEGYVNKIEFQPEKYRIFSMYTR
ncbi:unnamed protein product [Cylicocyclus nassatus]|uniref:Uncharacterized protein n=1 Tax=Cylicocyclus nassatus TaxID=53992 RepID=A0AA36GWD1_CYLNA|nr:unnamed protein product [Cylicocyclus nassatus]